MRLGLLLDHWEVRVEEALNALGGVQYLAFDSWDRLAKNLDAGALDVLIIELGDASLLRSLLLHRSGSIRNPNAAIMAIVQNDQQLDKALLSETGVTDFIRPPIGPNELGLRIGRLLFSVQAISAKTVLEVGAYRLDRREHTIFFTGIQVHVTPREFELGWFLFANLGHFVSRRQIAETVWGATVDIAERTLQTHMYNLRKKMRFNEQSAIRLRTVYSMGYRLDVAADAAGVADIPLPTQTGTV